MTTTNIGHRNKLTVIIGLSLLLTGCWGNNATTITSHQPTDSPQATTTPPAKSNDDTATKTNDASSTTNTTTQSTPTTKVTFPAVIQDAMKQFGSNSALPLYAPTIVPTAKAGAQAVSVLTKSSTDNSYDVQLLQTDKELPANSADAVNAKKLGSFSGHHFDSTETAQQQVRPLAGYLEAKSPGKLNLSGNVANDSVELGNGITAQTYLFSADRMSGKGMSQYAAIAWQEGHWDLEVTAIESRKLPTDIAKIVATYLHNNFLPVPNNKGTVYISIQPTGAIQSSVSWQQDTNVYVTHNENTTTDPVTTALDMMMSMHQVN